MTTKVRSCPLMNGDPCCLSAKDLAVVDNSGNTGACGAPVNIQDMKGSAAKKRTLASAQCPFVLQG